MIFYLQKIILRGVKAILYEMKIIENELRLPLGSFEFRICIRR